jgi:sortase A
LKLLIPKESLRLILRWTQHAMLAGAIALLGYSAFVLLDSWYFQNQQSRDLDRLLRNSPTASATRQTEPFPALQVPPQAPPEIAAGDLIGRIEIARLGLSAVVVEGIGGRDLRRAVGHIPGTPLPGQPGNAAIAGHRDTFFRPLKDIVVDDVIVLTTKWGEYRYRVVWSRMTSPEDVAVLDPTTKDVLTLVTCYPFYYVGPAPDRFIVRAERVSS